jgi:hypothetical protein
MNVLKLAILKWHPVAVLVVLVELLAEFLAQMDNHFIYISPAFAGTPEDVVGFGFWPAWFVIATWFCGACLLSYRVALQRRAIYWMPLGGAFLLLSFAAYRVYGILWSQLA